MFREAFVSYGVLTVDQRGIETLIEKTPEGAEFPSSKIALSLLFGFGFMFLVEQFSSHSHDEHSAPAALPQSSNAYNMTAASSQTSVIDPELDFDLSLSNGPTKSTTDITKAFQITLGLVVHALADGLALGAASISAGDASGAGSATDLSLIVFLALTIHKGAKFLSLLRTLYYWRFFESLLFWLCASFIFRSNTSLFPLQLQQH